MPKGGWLVLIAVGGLIGAASALAGPRVVLNSEVLECDALGCWPIGWPLETAENLYDTDLTEEPYSADQQSDNPSPPASVIWINRDDKSEGSGAGEAKPCEKENHSRNDRNCRDLLAQETTATWTANLGWLAVLTATLLIGTLLLNVRAIREARRVGEIQTRAYISIEAVKVKWHDTLGFTGLNIRPEYRNTGQSPAKKVAIGYRCFYDLFNQATPFVKVPELWCEEVSGGALGFKEVLFVDPAVMTEAAYKEWLRDPTARLYVAGRIFYTDIFGKKYSESFFRRFTKGLTKTTDGWTLTAHAGEPSGEYAENPKKEESWVGKHTSRLWRLVIGP